MIGKSHATGIEWVDPDDAPELTDEFFDKATPMVGDRVVTRAEADTALSKALARGRPRLAAPKIALTMRYDADVVKAFKATGAGWQTRMNAALREWLELHRSQ